MNEKTKEDYRKLAKNFYEKFGLTEDRRTAKNISDSLKYNASEYRPAYFRRLRNALAFDQAEKGFDKASKKINSVQNPTTKNKDRSAIKAKQKRQKSVSGDDFHKLFKAVREKQDLPLAGALLVSRHLGVRPIELFQISPLGDNKVFIKGAKKRDDRGLDREILLDEEDYKGLVQALSFLEKFKEDCESKGLKSTPEHLLQERLRTLTKKVFPRRKTHPTFYSFRHQLGSNLKGSGMNRSQVAYLMGHQSTESVEVYGDKRTSRSKLRIAPAVSQGQIDAVVRENHSKPMSQQPKPRENTSSISLGF